MINSYMPVRLYTGEGCAAAHAGLFAALGSRCVIVTGTHSAIESGALADCIRVLDECHVSYRVFNGIRQNPSLQSCMEAAQGAADFVIGIGGGSVLDAAKAVAVFAANRGLDEDGFYAKKWPVRPLPVVLIGTTAGTGSEVTKVAVLTDSHGRKHSIHDDLLYAAYAFGDPRYLNSVSEQTALYTAADVMMHAIESRFSKKADTLSKLYAEAAVKTVLEPLERLACRQARLSDFGEAVYEASILAGLAINTTGTCFPHNVGYYLTENYAVPHGAACAVFLPEFLDHVKNVAPEELRRFMDATGSTEETLLPAADRIIAELNIRLSRSEIEAALPRWENNGSVKNTIGTVSTDYIRSALMKFVKEN